MNDDKVAIVSTASFPQHKHNFFWYFFISFAPFCNRTGKYYSAHPFCDVNLVDHGYTVRHGHHNNKGYNNHHGGYNNHGHNDHGYGNRGYGHNHGHSYGNRGYDNYGYGGYNRGYGNNYNSGYVIHLAGQPFLQFVSLVHFRNPV